MPPDAALRLSSETLASSFILAELVLLTKRLLTGTGEHTVFTDLALFQQVYGDDLVIDLLNRADYLREVLQIVTAIESATAQRLALFWHYFGHILRPTEESRALVIYCLYTLLPPPLQTVYNEEAPSQIPLDNEEESGEEGQFTADEQALQDAMLAVLQLRAYDWLQLIAYGPSLTPALTQTHLAYLYKSLATKD
jgi:hypothetical protein